MKPIMKFAAIEDVIASIKAGNFIIVVDDEDRENEGDLIMAAELVTPEKIAFMIRYTSGIICVPMTNERLEELHLPPMVAKNTELHRTDFTVSVDYCKGITTGISSADRAVSIKALTDPNSKPADFLRPGHIFPLRYTEGGVLKRAGHTEAAVDFAKLANLKPIGVLCELVNDDGTMKRLPDLISFAQEHELLITSIADIISYRRKKEQLVRRVAQSTLNTAFGTFNAFCYQSVLDGTEHLALVKGEISQNSATLVRVQAEHVVCDVFGVKRTIINDVLEKMSTAESGVFIYLRGSEGRGIRLDVVHDDLTTPEQTNWPRYGIGAQILAELGVHDIILMTDKPTTFKGLEGYGLKIVKRVSLKTE